MCGILPVSLLITLCYIATNILETHITTKMNKVIKNSLSGI